MKRKKSIAENRRLADNAAHRIFWKKWGPYLSERQWGTVREDYSADGDAWTYLPFEHARSRVYRWGEDGLGGISDVQQNLCFALALWNGKDPMLKERLFGLTNREGNHGEDVKELYYYLDNTPTHSYMRFLYKYPQDEFPYRTLIEANRTRTRQDAEFELTDTGIFDSQKYFDVLVEYAKAGPDDIVIRIEVFNRGADEALLVLLPTLWFRNTWLFGLVRRKPEIMRAEGNDSWGRVIATHERLGEYTLYYQKGDALLMTENETNRQRVFGLPNRSPFVKDAFHDAVITGDDAAFRERESGTKCAPLYRLTIPGGGSQTVRLRLAGTRLKGGPFDRRFDGLFPRRLKEADEFYEQFVPSQPLGDAVLVQRQAFAGMLWNKQYYNYEIETWLEGDKGLPPPPEARKHGRNHEWTYLFNRDVISMPDKWEYPWYASWDLAFHCVPLAMIDPDFAKKQLILFLREWYMHPNGQLPSYEWNFNEVNPPVHAWAALKVYDIDRLHTGKGDVTFLKRVFHKLLLNFTWWVNRKDAEGRNIFQGGFLGLDNIGAFDRGRPLPGGGHVEQADGTSWMAMYSLNMMDIALEIAHVDPTYEDVASKFYEHFVHIAESLNQFGESGLWHEEDGFYYDMLHLSNGDTIPLRVRSLVGLTSLFAVSVINRRVTDRLKGFMKRLMWFRKNRAGFNKFLAMEEINDNREILLSLTPKQRLVRILQRMLDEKEFLSPGGIRSISQYHRENPFVLDIDGSRYRVEYEPAESRTDIFGGNSNWRGPIWVQINYLFIEALKKYYDYYGDSLKVEFPTGSGVHLDLWEVARSISQRITGMFIGDESGRRLVHGNETRYRDDPFFRNLILFHEYFDGDTCKGLGASHQTGWTGLVAEMTEWCWCR
jgi:hypothetical protein